MSFLFCCLGGCPLPFSVAQGPLIVHFLLMEMSFSRFPQPPFATSESGHWRTCPIWWLFIFLSFFPAQEFDRTSVILNLKQSQSVWNLFAVPLTESVNSLHISLAPNITVCQYPLTVPFWIYFSDLLSLFACLLSPQPPATLITTSSTYKASMDQSRLSSLFSL